jgi:hypothetical protein
MSQLRAQFDAVRRIVTDYGSGNIDVDRAAVLLAPAYAAAKRDRAQRSAATNDDDPDAAETPTPFVEVDVARQTGVITPQQYAALADRLAEAGES